MKEEKITITYVMENKCAFGVLKNGQSVFVPNIFASDYDQERGKKVKVGYVENAPEHQKQAKFKAVIVL
tara:strand:+ start:2354 stop:2560 length:207 start_codon:yes stop_codon:yes gene_type:complete